MNKHLLLLVSAILVINAELDKVLLPKAFLRWNLRNEYQKPIIFFEKQEIDGKQLNAISVPVREDSGLSEIKRILKQMLWIWSVLLSSFHIIFRICLQANLPFNLLNIKFSMRNIPFTHTRARL